MNKSVSVPSEVDMGEKVVIIGDMGVGKSSIMIRLNQDKFSEDLKSTVGCDHYEKEFLVDNRTVKLSLWDTAGQERFRGLASSYYRKAKCVVVVYDITRRSSFDKIEMWKQEISNFTDEQVCVFLIGNKLDEAAKRSVLREEG